MPLGFEAFGRGVQGRALFTRLKRAASVATGGLLMLIGSATTLPAQQNVSRGSSVVELYTSQGCSSCPPADRVLGELSTMPNVIALAFHVDYWDYIGWRDQFSMSDATARQHRYVQALSIPSAFTPQAVVDGRSSFVGSDKRGIVAALEAAATGEAVPVSLAVSDGTLTVAIPERQERKPSTVWVAAYLPKAQTLVGDGENSGRTLEEFNVVRQIRSIGIWSGRAAQFRTPLDSLPADASRIAVLVQQDGHGPIIGSAAVALR